MINLRTKVNFTARSVRTRPLGSDQIKFETSLRSWASRSSCVNSVVFDFPSQKLCQFVLKDKYSPNQGTWDWFCSLIYGCRRVACPVDQTVNCGMSHTVWQGTLTKMPPGVCSQLAYFRINRCGIFFGWNMSVVWSFWPNGIIFHLDFDAFIGLSDSKAAISGLDRVRGSLEGTMNRSCWWDISSRKNIACFDPSWWSFNLLHVSFIDVHVTFTT